MIKRLSILISFLLLAACDKNAGPGPDIHDSKYAWLDENGEVLTEKPDQWSCVLDQFTGLTWEVKTEFPGLHHKNNTYSWYNPTEPHPGSDEDEELDYRGTPDGGACEGSACDTNAWVEAVNQTGLCGSSDWRVASKDELASISDIRKADSPPTVNTAYFPNTLASEYWSANDYSFQYDTAWLWNFQLGHDRVEWKATPRHALLVRGEAMSLERVKD